jgi:hypothetical protein
MLSKEPHLINERHLRIFAVAITFIFFGLGGACGVNQNVVHPHDGGGGDAGPSCSNPPKDSDGDGISDVDEGSMQSPPTDTDHDGTPDYLDDDSDNDKIPDYLEARNGGSSCNHPTDSDGDGVPDFRDLDSDSPTNNTIPDSEELGPVLGQVVDTDGDGTPDYADVDNDGDGIPDYVELTATGGNTPATTASAAPDTDQDGVPDYMDTDSDGDGVPDRAEGMVDTDMDGTPNFRDLDSDGDCIPDSIELALDTDGDGAPDFLDKDSDSDGLLDSKEDPNCNGVVDSCETDRTKADTDNDGVNDLVEFEDCAVKTPAQQTALMCQCWGADPGSSPLTSGDFVFIVDYMKPPMPNQETLNLSTDVSQADVIFSIDTTGSMSNAITNLRTALSNTIVPQVKAKVSSVAYGVLDFKDFGDVYVVHYDHRIQTVGTMAGVTSVQNALNALAAGGGGDGPEAGWEAIYAIAGGTPIMVGGYSSVLPLASTPPQPPTTGETQGTLYGAGFRTGSVPIIVTVSDAEWHDAPGVATSGENGLNDYGSGQNGAPSRALALQRVNAVGGHVMAIAAATGGSLVTGAPKTRGIGTAQATGAVVTPADFGPVGTRPSGCSITQCCTGLSGAGESDTPAGSGLCPLSFTYDNSTGNGVSVGVVAGIVALANGLKFDIHVQAVDVDPNTIDNFMEKLVPNLSGMGPAAMCITMAPAPLQDNFTGPKAATGGDGVLDTFPQIGGGKQICFDVVPKMNTAVANTADPQFFRAQLQVKGLAPGGATINLGTPRDVFFLVPPMVVNGPIP